MDPRSKTRQISPVLVAVAVILGLSPAVSAQSPERRFEEAQRAQQNGDNALAATLYQSLLEEHPESTSAHANLGVALVALGKFDDAIEQYRIALEQAPGNRQLRSNLALAHYKKGDFEGASEEFFTLYQEERGDIPISTLLGDCYIRLGRTIEAITLLSAAEKPDPNNLAVEWALGNALIRGGQTQEGLQRIQKVAELGHSVDAYQLEANLYLGLTLFDQARDAANAAIRLNPNLAKPYVVLAMIDDFGGNEKDAERNYRKALDIDPNDLQARLQLANAFLIDRRLDEARQEIDRALSVDPASPSAHYELARVERAQGNLPAALNELEAISRKDPNWLQPHVELAALYYRLKRPSDGDREKEIVNQLRTEERDRRGQTHVISPRVPLP